MSPVIRIVEAVAGFAAATMVFMASSVFSASTQVHSPERWIREFFETRRPGTAMREVTIGNQHEVEICFDQCDIFRWRKLSQNDNSFKEKAWEFVFLFEHAKGVGVDYAGFREASRATFAELIRRNNSYCKKQTSDDSDPPYSCNWHQWSAALQIQVGEATYDEGLRCIAWKTGRTLKAQRQRCLKVLDNPWNSQK
ncbi:MAG: hypothetical protein WCK86_23640 [Planctomycetia bacterium]